MHSLIFRRRHGTQKWYMSELVASGARGFDAFVAAGVRQLTHFRDNVLSDSTKNIRPPRATHIGEGRDELLLAPCLLFFCGPWSVVFRAPGRCRRDHQASLYGSVFRPICLRSE